MTLIQYVFTIELLSTYSNLSQPRSTECSRRAIHSQPTSAQCDAIQYVAISFSVGVDELGLRRFQAKVGRNNIASLNLFKKKLQFKEVNKMSSNFLNESTGVIK